MSHAGAKGRSSTPTASLRVSGLRWTYFSVISNTGVTHQLLDDLESKSPHREMAAVGVAEVVPLMSPRAVDGGNAHRLLSECLGSGPYAAVFRPRAPMSYIKQKFPPHSSGGWKSLDFEDD
jgi:hypothetical protein